MTATATRSVTVEAGIDAVSATLADFAHLGDWSRAVDHCSALTEPASGLGAARRIQNGRFTVVETVTGWDLPATLAYRIDGLPTALGTVTNTWSLSGDGSRTIATLTTSVEGGPRPPARLVEKVAARALTRISDKLLADLAAHHAERSVGAESSGAAR